MKSECALTSNSQPVSLFRRVRRKWWSRKDFSINTASRMGARRLTGRRATLTTGTRPHALRDRRPPADCYPFLACCDSRGSLSATSTHTAHVSSVCSMYDRRLGSVDTLWSERCLIQCTTSVGSAVLIGLFSPCSKPKAPAAVAAEDGDANQAGAKVAIFQLIYIGDLFIYLLFLFT